MKVIPLKYLDLYKKEMLTLLQHYPLIPKWEMIV